MRLKLKKTAAAAVHRGHPWVFREGLARRPDDHALASGAAVELTDDEGALVARGLYDEGSPIAVRVFDRAPRAGSFARPLDDRALASRIEQAIARRDALFDDGTSAYRLCNGEGDRAPGFILDRYGDVAVIRLDGGLWAPHLDAVVARIQAPLRARGVATITLRLARGEQRGPEGQKHRVLAGAEPPARVWVMERGVRLEVDLAEGQKTGAFLDQRDNRARVRAAAKGARRALNLFSYTGGFSIAAALGGAAHVTSVDVASAAHASAQRMFRENGVDPGAHTFVSADAFAFLDAARARGDRFDLVISDPPSFAPNERARDKAIAAYRKLHAAIAAVLDDRATFCAASCSSHVTLEDFLSTLDDATLAPKTPLLVDVASQPADHPTIPVWPEGRYLKMARLVL